jgi:hypothetical protein
MRFDWGDAKRAFLWLGETSREHYGRRQHPGVCAWTALDCWEASGVILLGVAGELSVARHKPNGWIYCALSHALSI